MRSPIPSLTGMRFIAAMMVFLSHYSIPGSPDWLLQVTGSGYSGVTFFFVLSGFILAYNYGDGFASDPRRQFGPYAVSRFARVYPLYFVTMLYMWFKTDNVADVWQYVLALQSWSSDVKIAYGLNAPAWSISVEAFLYAMFPVVVIVLDKIGILRSRSRIVAAACVVAAIMVALASSFVTSGASELEWANPESAHRWLYRTPATRLFDLILGVLAAGFVRGLVPGNATKRAWELASYAAIIFSLALMACPSHHYSAYSWDVSFAIPSLIVILALSISPRSPLARLLGRPKIVSLGEASYALYLVHIPAYPMFNVPGAPPMLALGRYVMFLGVVLCLAYGLHVTVERPARRFIRSLAEARPLPAATDPVTITTAR